MKTTIQIPDSLFQQAQAAGASWEQIRGLFYEGRGA
jgi:hypothetical protein